MVVLVVVVAGLVIFAIAAAFVGRETWRLDAESPRPVFDEDEAVSWVAERLPFEVSAQLAHTDVWRIMAIALDLLPATGEDAMVEADAETLDAVMATEEAAERGWTRDQVAAVLALQVRYLEIIGAAGPDGG
jgi:hypothetical protein